MAFKLIESTHTRWRTMNQHHLVNLVHAGAILEKGRLLERLVIRPTIRQKTAS